MNKLFTKIGVAFVGIAMAVGVGVAVGAKNEAAKVDAAAGAGEAVYKTAVFSAANNHTDGGANDGKVSNYTTTWYNTTDSFRWDISRWSNNNNGWNGSIKCGNKNGSATQTATLTTNSTVSIKIVKVELSVTGVKSSGNYTVKLYMGTSSWTEIGSFTEASGDQSVSIPEATQATGQKYKVEVAFTSKPSNNGDFAIDGITLYQKASGTINSVTVKAGTTTGTLNVTSGSNGWTNVQLTAEVSKTGTISSDVTWSSADSTKVGVTTAGVARILASTGDEGVEITATSVADGTKSGKIKIIAKLGAYTGTVETTVFSTESYGSNDIKPFDSDGKANSGLTNVRIVTADNDNTVNNSGFYKNAPTSLRVYNKHTTTISVADGYIIDHVKIISSTAASTTPISPTNIVSDKGALLFDGNDAFNDLTNIGSSATSVTYTTNTGPIHIGSISVAYHVAPEKEIEDFATSFVTTLSASGVCGTTSASYNRNNLSALTEEQTSGKTLWVEQKEAFEALSPEAKALFGTSEVAIVVRAKTLYLHIIDRYGLDTWDSAPAASSSRIGGLATLTNDGNVVVIIAVIAAVSALAVGGYFLLKKKKEQ